MPCNENESATHKRLDAVGCLKNAHGHIAQAYAYLDGQIGAQPSRQRRAIRETLDAVDWLRRALERLDELDA